MGMMQVTLFHDEWRDFVDFHVLYPDGTEEVLTFVEDADEANDDEGDIHLQPFDVEGCEQWAREVAASMGYAGCQIAIGREG